MKWSIISHWRIFTRTTNQRIFQSISTSAVFVVATNGQNGKIKWNLCGGGGGNRNLFRLRLSAILINTKARRLRKIITLLFAISTTHTSTHLAYIYSYTHTLTHTHIHTMYTQAAGCGGVTFFVTFYFRDFWIYLRESRWYAQAFLRGLG